MSPKRAILHVYLFFAALLAIGMMTALNVLLADPSGYRFGNLVVGLIMGTLLGLLINKTFRPNYTGKMMPWTSYSTEQKVIFALCMLLLEAFLWEVALLNPAMGLAAALLPVIGLFGGPMLLRYLLHNVLYVSFVIPPGAAKSRPFFLVKPVRCANVPPHSLVSRKA